MAPWLSWGQPALSECWWNGSTPVQESARASEMSPRGLEKGWYKAGLNA